MKSYHLFTKRSKDCDLYKPITTIKLFLKYEMLYICALNNTNALFSKRVLYFPIATLCIS